MYNVHMSSLYTKESVPFRESLQNVKVYLISYNILAVEVAEVAIPVIMGCRH